jgi:hypothetical protein
MPITRNISANQLTIWATLLLGLIVAVFVGTLVGSQDFTTVGILFGAVAAVIYMGALSPYWIWLAMTYAFFGFMIRPFGPSISPLNMSLGMALVFVFGYFWRKSGKSRAQEANWHYFRVFRISIIIYITYMLLQSAVSKFYPHTSALMSWNNILKQNLDMWAPFVFVLISLKYAQFCKLPRNFGNWFVVILTLALIVNTAIRAYATFVLNMGAREDVLHDPTIRYRSAVSIEGINLTDDQYLLRSLAPFAILSAVAFITCWHASPRISRLLSFTLLIVSLIAAFFAGGRATVILALLVPAFFLALQRRSSALVVGAAASILLLVSIRYTYDINYKLVPLMVQRSVAMIPGMEMREARESIAGSSDWRWDVAIRAFDEWSATPRTILIGRSVYAYTAEDITAMLLDPLEGTIKTSLLRGATHNTITDLLLISGIVGLLLFYTTYFSVIWGIFCIYRARSQLDLLAVLCLIFLVYSITLFFTGIVGGGFFWNTGALLACAIIVLSSKEQLPSAARHSEVKPALIAQN